MIKIITSENYVAEKQYIFNVIFAIFLEIPFCVEFENRSDICMQLSNNREIILPDIFFSFRPEEWLTKKTLPVTPLMMFDVRKILDCVSFVSQIVPVIYGDNCYSVSDDGNKIRLPIDIFGSSFFMLTRYEEMVKTEKDQHGRFPLTASLSYQEGFLERPVVNEYVEILWACLKKLCPSLTRKKYDYTVCITHDIDKLSTVIDRSWLNVLRNAVGDIYYRKSICLSMRRLFAKSFVNRQYQYDPCVKTFDMIMDQVEKRGLKSAFYFIAGTSVEKDFDSDYDIREPVVRKIIKKIAVRGHEIGLHPSYATYKDCSLLKAELNILQRITDELGVNQKTWGGRQHYLRWENPMTWQNWEDAGFTYDSSLMYAECVGFRCGTCYEYPVFNILTRRQLNLLERPLVVMDFVNASSEQKYYADWINEKALRKIKNFRDTCRIFGGVYTLLFHNNGLMDKRHRAGFSELLDFLVG
ncbi:conserved hypothetical protein [Gammaproteobacteria bacterium]